MHESVQQFIFHVYILSNIITRAIEDWKAKNSRESAVLEPCFLSYFFEF